MDETGNANGLENCPELRDKTIAPLGQIIEARRMLGGDSGDRTYRVHFYGYDASYLLRLFDEASLAFKRAEFEALHRMQSISVRCSRPIAMGRWEPDGPYFQLLSYIEGENAERALPASPAPQQLRVGMQAGEELRRIGSYEAPGEIRSWSERYRSRAEQEWSRLEARSDLPPCARAALGKARGGLDLIEKRPSAFLHGSFVPSNLIVQNGRLAGVVGFGRFGWGDPLYEFAKLGLHARAVSPLFCTGQILGYYGGQEPEAEFWELYALYAACGALSLLAESIDAGPETSEAAVALIERLARDHEGFYNDRPSWFGML